MAQATNPEKLLIEGYEDSELGIQITVNDADGNPIDLAADYKRIQFRAWTRGNKESAEIDVDTDGDLSINNTNELVDVYSTAEIAPFVYQTSFWQLIFIYPDSAPEVILAGVFLINGAENLGGEINNEFTVEYNPVTNQVNISDTVDLVAKAKKAKQDTETLRDETQDLVNSVNLPTIQSGDADKILQVLDDESGYELIKKYWDLINGVLQTSQNVVIDDGTITIKKQGTSSGETAFAIETSDGESINFKAWSTGNRTDDLIIDGFDNLKLSGFQLVFDLSEIDFLGSQIQGIEGIATNDGYIRSGVGGGETSVFEWNRLANTYIRADGYVQTEGEHRFDQISQQPLSSDPPDPDAGNSVQWVSDGTGSGDAGDVMIKINVGGTVKTKTLIDYSAI